MLHTHGGFEHPQKPKGYALSTDIPLFLPSPCRSIGRNDHRGRPRRCHPRLLVELCRLWIFLLGASPLLALLSWAPVVLWKKLMITMEENDDEPSRLPSHFQDDGKGSHAAISGNAPPLYWGRVTPPSSHAPWTLWRSSRRHIAVAENSQAPPRGRSESFICLKVLGEDPTRWCRQSMQPSPLRREVLRNPSCKIMVGS
jgi:hypothetical protein